MIPIVVNLPFNGCICIYPLLFLNFKQTIGFFVDNKPQSGGWITLKKRLETGKFTKIWPHNASLKGRCRSNKSVFFWRVAVVTW